MKTIGLLGGMSWESTRSYYQAINQGVNKALGGLSSAKLCLYSVNFDEIEKLQHQGDWAKTAEILAAAAQGVEASGADFLLICTNTMHKVADTISAAINIPLLHIADATADQLTQNKITKVGLLGTKFTMEQDFYKGRLTDKFGIDVIVPSPEEQDIIHNVIYQELCLGQIKPQSKQQYLHIINELHKKGAQAIILGCTEIALLINQKDTNVTLFDTTAIHAQAAIKLALE
ncbi:MAG: aspartate/glutamate racemase family protein [Thalassotalea sp.]